MTDSNYWKSVAVRRGMGRRAFLRSTAVTGAGAAAFLAGCRGSGTDTPAAGDAGGGTGASDATASALYAVPEAKYGGTIAESFSYEPIGWDPQASVGAGQGSTIEATSIKLIRHDYRRTPPWKNGNETLIMGELAEKWENPDPLTYTFTIRKGINWPDQDPMNGRPITAKDVAYTFAHAKTDVAVVQSYVFDPIENVTAIDDYTVQFKLETPNWLFPNTMNSYSTMILPDGIYEWTGPGAWDSTKSRGGGPWIVDEYRPGSFISYKPNPNFKKVFGVPYADKLIMPILIGRAPQLQAFVGKQIFKMSIPPGQLDTITKARPEVKTKLDTFAATATQGLFPNTQSKPFDDVRVRRAISMAVDRDGWGETLQLPYKLESGPITWGYPDWKLAVEDMPPDIAAWVKYNPEEAAKLLQAAGVSSSAKYTIHMHPYNESYTPDAALLIDSLTKIGMTAELKVYDYNNWIANIYYTLDPKAWDGMLYGPDNLDRIQQQLYDRFSPSSNRNHSFIKDDQMTKWLTDFASAKTPEEAMEVSNNMQERSVDQGWSVYRPQPTSPLAWDPSVQNYEGESEFSYNSGYRSAFLWMA